MKIPLCFHHQGVVPTIGSSLLNLMGMPQFAQDNDSEKRLWVT